MRATRGAHNSIIYPNAAFARAFGPLSCMCMRMHLRVRAYVRICACAYVHVCAYAYVFVCAHTCVRALCTCVRV